MNDDDGRPAEMWNLMLTLADWMSVLDRAVEVLGEASGIEPPAPGDQIQKDLARLSDWFFTHPEIDKQIHSEVFGVKEGN